MDRKRKNYSSLSKRHFRRIIANNTASDLLNISNLSNNDHFELRDDELLQSDTIENLEPVENEFVNRNNELVNDLIESDTVNDIELNEEVGKECDSSDNDTSSNEITEESVAQYMRNAQPDNEIDNQEGDQFIKDIVSWAIRFNIFHVALVVLLVILRKYTRHSFPKNPRTLLNAKAYNSR